MPNYRKYFHDRFVLLMLTINGFVAFVCVASVLFRLGNTNDVYIQHYRSNLGLNGFEAGGVGEIISFAVFAVFILVMQFIISLRLHHLNKAASRTVMMLSSLLLILCLIVSNSLLALR